MGGTWGTIIYRQRTRVCFAGKQKRDGMIGTESARAMLWMDGKGGLCCFPPLAVYCMYARELDGAGGDG